MPIDAPFRDHGASRVDSRNFHLALGLVVETHWNAVAGLAHDAAGVASVRHIHFALTVIDHYYVGRAADRVESQVVIFAFLAIATICYSCFLSLDLVQDLHQGRLHRRIVPLGLRDFLETTSIKRLVNFEESFAQTLLKVTTLVLFDFFESFLEVALGVLGNLAATVAIKDSENVLLWLKLQVVDSCVLLFTQKY